jgi:hypothetical protein
MVSHTIQGDGVKPGGQFGFPAETAEMGMDAHENFLQNVFGFFPLAKNTTRHFQEGRPVSLHKEGKSRPVSA